MKIFAKTAKNKYEKQRLKRRKNNTKKI